MADYLVGITGSLDTYTEFLLQVFGLGVEADEYEAKDGDGNTAAHQLINHRAKINVEAIIPKGQEIPVVGQTVSVKGVSLPTVAADGTVTGGIKIDESVSTGVNFKITGTSQIDQSNAEFDKARLELTAWLVNTIPGAPSAG